ncbi:MAG: large-conductance mechanosensitive channel protein MscL [Clostridiales bacterium]|nr:large-conductance mechanosensitive channel protein MscL [Clostridiales bacterium]
MVKEFKEFISKGNVLDMAVGVIIGGAFGKIVTSLVNDIIMPAIGKACSGVDFKDMKYVLEPEVLDAAGEIEKAEVAIRYGEFINTIIEFFIIAICIFLVITIIQKSSKKFMALIKKEEAEAAKEEPAEPSEEVKLLTEIRDALKAGK